MRFIDMIIIDINVYISYVYYSLNYLKSVICKKINSNFFRFILLDIYNFNLVLMIYIFII